MRRHRTHSRSAAPTSTPVPCSLPLASRSGPPRSHARGRGADRNGQRVLVTVGDDPRKIAHAAWSIVAATGGLIDRAEIARRYRLSRGRVHQLTQQRHFPRPVQGEGTSHPWWLAADVDAYRSQPPPVGRPPKQQRADRA